ncbi:MAG: deoxynucleoside kinase [Anaerolineaceae bacterium]|nr:deoxynucleoside kinase [Anaerolineaceae bacterium]
MSTSKKLVLLAGNIGSGKTSLTRLLGQKLGWKTAFESVSDNPYLPAFYRDMKTWSFHLQVYFLGSRAEQHCKLAACPEPAIIDRSIYEDAFIFARALNAMGNLNQTDYETYLNLYQLVIDGLPKPDLLIYLKAPVSELMQRIQIRARAIESGISQEYLELLNRYYEEWTDQFDICPMLSIESGDLDFVHQPKHLDIVIKKILERLMGKEELHLP